jgi:cell wall-associated NlpC family hydrolase
VRRFRWAAAVAVLTTVIATAPAPAVALPAGHHHSPSAAAVAAGKRAVARRAHEVRVEARRVGRARGALARLNVGAEVAVEAYDGAKVKLATAQHAAHTAQLVLAGANAQVAAGQLRAAQFATAAYKTGGVDSVSAYLEPGGPSKLVRRIGAIDAISSAEHTTLQRYEAARIYQAVVSRQANAVAAKALTAAAAAAKAKLAAQRAVSRQSVVLTGLRHQQATLAALLQTAKTRAGRLERERLAAIARARRLAAARQAAPPPVASGPSPFAGASGSTSGTVSATTALAALHAAESQIGKPYQWGAAGPNTYDCSGLVLWSYGQVGIHLDHWTGDQWNEGAHISQSELRPGDLVFFAYNTSDPSTIHHVGMYIGNGEMVDAPFTGADVRYDSAFRPDYIGAVRPYQR